MKIRPASAAVIALVALGTGCASTPEPVTTPSVEPQNPVATSPGPGITILQRSEITQLGVTSIEAALKHPVLVKALKIKEGEQPFVLIDGRRRERSTWADIKFADVEKIEMLSGQSPLNPRHDGVVNFMLAR